MKSWKALLAGFAVASVLGVGGVSVPAALAQGTKPVAAKSAVAKKAPKRATHVTQHATKKSMSKKHTVAKHATKKSGTTAPKSK